MLKERHFKPAYLFLYDPKIVIKYVDLYLVGQLRSRVKNEVLIQHQTGNCMVNAFIIVLCARIETFLVQKTYVIFELKKIGLEVHW